MKLTNSPGRTHAKMYNTRREGDPDYEMIENFLDRKKEDHRVRSWVPCLHQEQSRILTRMQDCTRNER
jgi:hypothetical protein